MFISFIRRTVTFNGKDGCRIGHIFHLLLAIWNNEARLNWLRGCGAVSTRFLRRKELVCKNSNFLANTPPYSKQARSLLMQELGQLGKKMRSIALPPAERIASLHFSRGTVQCQRATPVGISDNLATECHVQLSRDFHSLLSPSVAYWCKF